MLGVQDVYALRHKVLVEGQSQRRVESRFNYRRRRDQRRAVILRRRRQDQLASSAAAASSTCGALCHGLNVPGQPVVDPATSSLVTCQLRRWPRN